MTVIKLWSITYMSNGESHSATLTLGESVNFLWRGLRTTQFNTNGFEGWDGFDVTISFL